MEQAARVMQCGFISSKCSLDVLNNIFCCAELEVFPAPQIMLQVECEIEAFNCTCS
jgi:hypothetical protein